MRGIRNDFAHVRRRVRYKDESIKDRCKLLRGANAFENGTGNPIEALGRDFYSVRFLPRNVFCRVEKRRNDRKPHFFILPHDSTAHGKVRNPAAAKNHSTNSRIEPLADQSLTSA